MPAGASFSSSRPKVSVLRVFSLSSRLYQEDCHISPPQKSLEWPYSLPKYPQKSSADSEFLHSDRVWFCRAVPRHSCPSAQDLLSRCSSQCLTLQCHAQKPNSDQEFSQILRLRCFGSFLLGMVSSIDLPSSEFFTTTVLFRTWELDRLHSGIRIFWFRESVRISLVDLPLTYPRDFSISPLTGTMLASFPQCTRHYGQTLTCSLEQWAFVGSSIQSCTSQIPSTPRLSHQCLLERGTTQEQSTTSLEFSTLTFH